MLHEKLDVCMDIPVSQFVLHEQNRDIPGLFLPNLVLCGLQEKLSSVFYSFGESQVHCLVIVNEENKIEGMLLS